jgi:uncharacterized protein YrrD
MLRSVRDLMGYRLGATDGVLGKVKDLYFDDASWTARYLVADTGTWLSGHQVLLSPYSLQGVDDEQSLINVALSRQRIEDSPPILCDEPVSRQFERKYYTYYGWPFYWAGPGLWGAGAYPYYGHGTNPVDTLPAPDAVENEPTGDPHLRSVREVTGYGAQARDEAVGEISDFVVADEDWAIRYLVIDTGTWWTGKKVLLAPQWIEKVSWMDRAVYADLYRDTIKQAPEYDSSKPISREYEQKLFRHYDRRAYWTNDYIAESK